MSETKVITKDNGGPGPRTSVSLGSLLGGCGLTIIIIQTITIIIVIMDISNAVTIIIIVI